jgi:hypothetical protein
MDKTDKRLHVGIWQAIPAYVPATESDTDIMIYNILNSYGLLTTYDSQRPCLRKWLQSYLICINWHKERTTLLELLTTIYLCSQNPAYKIPDYVAEAYFKLRKSHLLT